MRRILLLVLAFVFTLVAGAVLAQDHANTIEKLVKQRITFGSDTRVGGTVLKAGEYRVICDRTTITFQQGKTELKVPCKGPEMKAPADRNEVHTVQGAGGVLILQKLLLKGSNVEHAFD